MACLDGLMKLLLELLLKLFLGDAFLSSCGYRLIQICTCGSNRIKHHKIVS